MKRMIKWIFPLLLTALLIGSAVWYMFVYDPTTVQEFLTSQARYSAQQGKFDTAAWLYKQSYKLSGQDQNIAIELAEIYKSVGNYTKAESTLTKAVADGGDTELYIALCKTYVEQDKLLDAVNMLDNVSDPAVKASLDSLRPLTPICDYTPGFYTQYISLTFQPGENTLYVTTDGAYPTTAREAYSEPVALSSGETKVYALAVAENGLVSPLSVLTYTVGGVIEPITLEDEVIEANVREMLMFGENTQIHSDDLWTITEFTVPQEAVVLEDLRHFTYLKKLTISGHDLESLSFLSPMTQLEELVITECTMPDELDLIAALPGLKRLTLENCSLSTIAKLDKAIGLTQLDLSSNAIGDISVLSNMSQLTVLDLSHNAVTDLTAINSLSHLAELDVSYNSISSIAPAGLCLELKKLDLSHNSVSDLSPLSTLTGLTHFYAGNNNLTDVNVLAGCVGLRELNVSNNHLVDISPLYVLTMLEKFDFSYNDVEVLPAFPTNCALVEINGEHNFMTDISALGGMPNLTHVYMDYNNLTDISFLANCPNLVQVNVYGTDVSNVDALLAHSIIVNFDPTT